MTLELPSFQQGSTVGASRAPTKLSLTLLLSHLFPILNFESLSQLKNDLLPPTGNLHFCVFPDKANLLHKPPGL